MPAGHTFRSLPPKTQVKIGLVLWKSIIEKYQTALEDGSLFDSVELLEKYSKLSAEDKLDFLVRCGPDTDRETNEGARHCKQRKRRAAGDLDENLSKDPSIELEEMRQRLQQEHDSLPQTGMFSADQVRAMLMNILAPTQMQ